MITKQQRMTRSQIGIIVLSAAVAAMYIAAPARAVAGDVWFEFGGTVTDVMGGPNSPWDVVQVGDPWSMTYHFESTTTDTYLLPTIGTYPAITSYELTIGSAPPESAGVDPNSTFINVYNDWPNSPPRGGISMKFRSPCKASLAGSCS